LACQEIFFAICHVLSRNFFAIGHAFGMPFEVIFCFTGLIIIKNQFKKLKEKNFDKNGVFSKILFVKRRKRQKRQKRKKLIKAESFVFFLRFVIVAAPFTKSLQNFS
jgi:hypothetical protein